MEVRLMAMFLVKYQRLAYLGHIYVHGISDLLFLC